MISVVIPLYNKQSSIVATLQSVLAQTYTDYEVIVVDDGSTDNSAQVVEEFIRASSLSGVPDKVHGFVGCSSPLAFRLIRKENGGVSSARNEGILAAEGEYIAFLDGDDLWHPEYLATLHRLMVDYPDAVIYGIGYTTLNGNNIPSKISSPTKRGEVNDVWNNYPGYWTGSTCCRKEHLVIVGLFDTRMTHGEDIDMWWRLLLQGNGAYDSTILAYYRQDAENRAMHKVIPLEKHIPYYIEKYASARAENKAFRRFFDREMIYRLYPYLFDKRYRKQARQLAKQMDYSLQKWTMHFRMVCPYLYRIYEKLK